MRARLVFGFAAVMAASFGFLSVANADTGGDSTAYHLYRTPALRAAHPIHPNFLKGGAPLVYYGGPVLSHVKLVAVMWGPNVSSITKRQIGDFFSATAKSTFMDQLAQYQTNLTGTNGHAGTDQQIGRGSYAGLFTIAPLNHARKLSDTAVQTELRAQISAGKLPKADADTLYMIYFPFSIKISSYGQSCVSFSAYHSASPAAATAKTLFYGIMPDCGDGFSSLTVSSSHEIAEAVTDGIPTPGSHPAYPQAWNTTDGYEVGDLCESRPSLKLTSATHSYSVSSVYLNDSAKCSTGHFTSP